MAAPKAPKLAGQGSVTLDEAVFGERFHGSLVHEAVRAELAAKRRTQVGLTVHSVDSDQNLLLVKGAIPGPKNGVVEIREEKRGGSS